MKNKRIFTLGTAALALGLWACQSGPQGSDSDRLASDTVAQGAVRPSADISEKLQKYTQVRLTADLGHLSNNERQMIGLLIQAADIMDGLFWQEAYGNPNQLLQGAQDRELARYIGINYGPWDRVANNEPFVEGVGPKPEGANFYPADMTKEEFEAAQLADKTSQYTLLRRNDQGQLITVPYHQAFAEEVKKASDLLKQAAALAEDAGLKKYLELRAQALLTDEYQPSDLAWMDMKTNRLDVVIGPIETYEDHLFGYKAAHEAYVLIKDMAWSERLAKYASFLPELQRNLPVDARYKQETPGTDSDLNAYDVVYYAGDCNAGSKTIAINLPNDEEVQLQKGTRRLQLKNAMRAKFDEILEPIADELIADDQRKYITFDAFFANTMFHEVAHGLGIKNTINNKGSVREALKELGSALEEGKADVLGLYMVTQLHEKGQLEGRLEEYYTTFLASIFRSVRFGASSAHGRANMVRFNYFAQKGAFARDAQTGKYRVDFAKMRQAMNDLSRDILVMQGNGDYAAVSQLVEQQGSISAELQADLDRLAAKSIPVDVVFEQGMEVLGLN
ncbi:dipeptidyl-peptidase 3 family protein [Cesiribacter andamanensis]|uniref:Peptidase family M49 n=1 Tax=Cesiribacter andamanensis AMV16 TaxID=1279009 RepID=M7N3E1_9BACT|nr:peptidase M49 [Cesiribacter andamanensis]EMR01787.1 Peptidase family M49 [Cesiribacter andamanensis AMV16]